MFGGGEIELKTRLWGNLAAVWFREEEGERTVRSVTLILREGKKRSEPLSRILRGLECG